MLRTITMKNCEIMHSIISRAFRLFKEQLRKTNICVKSKIVYLLKMLLLTLNLAMFFMLLKFFTRRHPSMIYTNIFLLVYDGERSL